MRSGDAFKGSFLKADDIKGRKVSVVIDEVTMEEVGQGNDKAEKPVLHFRGKDKGLVLNKTNWNLIAEFLGSDESDDWLGKGIVLGTAKVDFAGKRVDAIRVLGASKKVAPPVEEPKGEPDDFEESLKDDSVPF